MWRHLIPETQLLRSAQALVAKSRLNTFLKGDVNAYSTRACREAQALPKLKLTGGKQVALRNVVLDLHANGEADGLPGAALRIVMPADWRDLPRTPNDPPFWAVIWPSGSALAAWLLRHRNIVAGKTVCDLGCGLGTGGIAAGLAGCTRVALADRNMHALQCAALGAAANGLTVASAVGQKDAAIVSTSFLDWHDEDSVARLAANGPFDVLLACDVLAEAGVVGMSAAASIAPLALLAHRLLRPGGHLLLVVHTESPYRPPINLPLVLDVLCNRNFSQSGEIIEARGAQLPGEGPEGLAPSRKVSIVNLVPKSKA